MATPGEIFDIVDSSGAVIGAASRSDVHGNPSLVHRVVHLLVFDRLGNLLLQKRSLNKDVAPGMWDTSVGGHVEQGEDVHTALHREAKEELGIEIVQSTFLYEYLFSNHRESELVSTFIAVYEGEVAFNVREIDEVRYWSIQRIRDHLGNGIFSNHFEQEFSQYLRYLDSRT